MSTVAQNLQTLAAIKEDIRQAIVDKGQTCPVDTPFVNYADKIEAISGGGDEYEEKPIKDVTFFDYDGRVPYSYTAQEFLALEALPSLPTHEGLTAQGWNWTLADAQAHVRKYRQLNIGAHYVTDTGETRLYISLAQSMEIECWLTATDPTKITIDWGDGTTTEGWSTSTNKHTYAVGNYVMRISATGGATYQLGQGLYQRNVLGQYTTTNVIKGCSLEKVEIGSAVTNIAAICFYSCYNLQSYAGPAIPIGNQAFYNCRALSFVTLPQNIGTGVLQATQIMRYISYAFNSSQSTTYLIPAYNRRRETWGDTLTTIVSQTLNSASSMYEIYIPDSVTSIAYQAFINSITLREIYIYPTTPPTLGASAFTLAAGAKIYVPHGKLNDYQTAENWAAYASYMVEMDE